MHSGRSPLRELVDNVHAALQGDLESVKGLKGLQSMKKRVPRIQQAAERLRQAIADYQGEPEYLAEAYSVLCSTVSICHSLQDLPDQPSGLVGLFEEGIARIPAPFHLGLQLTLTGYVSEEAALQLVLAMPIEQLDACELSYLEIIVDGRLKDGAASSWRGLREAITEHKSKSQNLKSKRNPPKKTPPGRADTKGENRSRPR